MARAGHERSSAIEAHTKSVGDLVVRKPAAGVIEDMPHTITHLKKLISNMQGTSWPQNLTNKQKQHVSRQHPPSRSGCTFLGSEMMVVNIQHCAMTNSIIYSTCAQACNWEVELSALLDLLSAPCTEGTNHTLEHAHKSLKATHCWRKLSHEGPPQC